MSLKRLLGWCQWGPPPRPQPAPVHTTAPIIHCASCAMQLASCVYCGQVHETQITPICPACTQIAQVGMLLHERGHPSETTEMLYAFD
jgi:hypothetical protein